MSRPAHLTGVRLGCWQRGYWAGRHPGPLADVLEAGRALTDGAARLGFAAGFAHRLAFALSQGVQISAPGGVALFPVKRLDAGQRALIADLCAAAHARGLPQAALAAALGWTPGRLSRHWRALGLSDRAAA